MARERRLEKRGGTSVCKWEERERKKERKKQRERAGDRKKKEWKGEVLSMCQCYVYVRMIMRMHIWD